jgi:AraC-like DNA-binding protein
MTSDFDTQQIVTPQAIVRPIVHLEPATPAPTAMRPATIPPSRSAESFSVRARAAIARLLLQGDASVSQVARELGTSCRTLQRRLQQDGTTLQDLVASVRFELAIELLASPARSASEVSQILGFSAPSAFHRAFKRWTGATPGQFRKERVRPVGHG